MKTFFGLFFSVLLSTAVLSQSFEEGYKSIEKGDYKTAIETFELLANSNIENKPSTYIKAKLGLAESYTDVGVIRLSIQTLEELKAYILRLKTEHFLELSRIHLMLADNYELLFNQIQFLKHVNEFYNYYRKTQKFDHRYEAAYHAYTGRYHNINFNFEKAYDHTSKALKLIKSNTTNDNLWSPPIIETYQVYAAHCFTLRNYGKLDVEVKQKFFDTLNDEIDKRFYFENIKKAKSIVNTSSFMLDRVFNYFENNIRKEDSLKNPEKAYHKLIASYEKGVSIYRDILGKKADYLPRYYGLQSWLAYGKGDISFGLDLTDKAIQAYSMSDYIDTGVVPNYSRVMASLRFKTFLLESQYEKTKDTSLLQKNLQVLHLTEKLWVNYQEDQINSKQDFLNNSYNQNPYQYLLKNYIELYSITKNEAYLDKIQTYDEKSKYNSLAISLQQNGEKNELIRKEIYLLMDNLFLCEILKRPCQKEIEKQIKQKLEQLERLQTENKKTKTYDVTQVQDKLKPNEAQISYSQVGLGVNKIYAKLITNTEIKIIEVDSLKDIYKYQKLIVNLKTSLKTNDVDDFKDKSHELYSLLFKKVSEELPVEVDKIEIIPFAHIESLPFDLLISSNPETKDYRKLPYLINKYTFKYAFSETIKELTLQNSSGNNGEMDFFTPDFEQTIQNDLKLSDSFIEKVDSELDANFYSGEEASLSNFKKSLSSSSHITLISHANSDQEIFNQNKGLYLQDGFLSLDSIYQLKSDADLLVLTACETGEGYIDIGEGNMSLARAFASTGVKSLMVSSWEIDEMSTMKILDGFFEHYKDDLVSSRSLRQAKLNYIQTSIPRTANPMYWAGLNIVGTESFFEVKGFELTTYASLGMGFIVLLVIIFLLFKKRIKNF